MNMLVSLIVEWLLTNDLAPRRLAVRKPYQGLQSDFWRTSVGPIDSLRAPENPQRCGFDSQQPGRSAGWLLYQRRCASEAEGFDRDHLIVIVVRRIYGIFHYSPALFSGQISDALDLDRK